ncbi:MAG: zinc-binding dehydrogenase [Actinomycetota bacterium]
MGRRQLSRRRRALRAVVISNGDLRIVERSVPEPAADQVLVEVRGAGVNRADLLQRLGRHPAPPGWPDDVPGLELAGVVAAVGESVGSLQPGDAVFGIVGGGAHATHALTTESLCVPVSRGLDLVEAGGVPEVFITAHDALITQAEVRPGERVLIHGVGSGVGTALVQLVRAIGAQSVGTARTPEKLDRARDLGLDDAVLAGPDMAAAIGEVDAVVDLVGGDYMEVDVKVCRPQGRIVLVGLLAGAGAHLDLGRILTRRLVIRGTVLRSRPEWQKAQATAAFAAQVAPLFERKILRPVIDRVVPLGSAADAYDALASNEAFGKLVLAPEGV